MRLTRFVWDNWNRDHVSRHQVTEEEVESVFLSRPEIRSVGSRRYTAHGTTWDGRYLLGGFRAARSGRRLPHHRA